MLPNGSDARISVDKAARAEQPLLLWASLSDVSTKSITSSVDAFVDIFTGELRAKGPCELRKGMFLPPSSGCSCRRGPGISSRGAGSR
jgi:hypothetical protein